MGLRAAFEDFFDFDLALRCGFDFFMRKSFQSELSLIGLTKSINDLQQIQAIIPRNKECR